jgi:hypothetical protein
MFCLQCGPLRVDVAGLQGHLPRRLWQVSAHLSLDLSRLCFHREAMRAIGERSVSPRSEEPRRGGDPESGGCACIGAIACGLAARARLRLARHDRALRPRRCGHRYPTPTRRPSFAIHRPRMTPSRPRPSCSPYPEIPPTWSCLVQGYRAGKPSIKCSHKRLEVHS